MPNDLDAVARSAVKAVLKNLSDRSGFDNILDSLDAETRREMERSLVDDVRKVLDMRLKDA